MATLEELQAEVEALRAAERTRQQEAERARIQSLPMNERPLYERELRVRQQEQALAERQRFLDEAALTIKKKEYAQQLYVPESEFDGLNSIEAMTVKARELTMNMEPNKLRALASLQETLAAGGTPDAATVTALTGVPQAGAEGTAAGATAVPTGMGTATGGGTAPSGPSPAEEITARHAGKGATDVASWLAEKRASVPMETVSLGSGTPVPAPNYTQAQPGAASPGPVQGNSLTP